MMQKKIKNRNNMLEIVELILYFTKPKQILTRLPIFLAQLKAGNNSEKLKDKFRQLLYSWYRSKKLTRQFYKSLVDVI